MGYACPVCETPQSDAEHLANHLAFTAMLGDDDHEAWLDDHAPGWNEDGEDELAERIEEYAKEVGFPQVFEDTTHDHDHGHDHFEDELERANSQGRGSMASSARAGASGAAALDGDAQSILQEAQEMTEQMLDDESEQKEADAGEESADGDTSADSDGKRDER
ncbi:DUF5810 domain-containing protein [Halorussus pelagicus]|uniref:DUF5810 domain-containing protein n=1 Tax=Halorussus pelagicus TaxID=2505977 RepID=UPI000FFC8209|nr:DUF5810 domain-containing protein [Halorussus pelagicus]